MQASKWLNIHVLLGHDEMVALCSSLGRFSLYLPGVVLPRGSELLSLTTFLEVYATYVDTLRRGELPVENSYQRPFSSAWTCKQEAIELMQLPHERVIARICSPVVQLQPHTFHYSSLDQKFRSMVYGQDTITWGIQFSYPQIYADSKTQHIIEIFQRRDDPNTHLFRQLQHWVRAHTLATPMTICSNRKVNLPMRLGRSCLPWINHHPQLQKYHLRVGTHVL